jgi:hypothetical protein
MIKFYQTGSAWLLDNHILEAGSCYGSITEDETKIQIKTLDKDTVLAYDLFTNFEDSAGTPYTKETFLAVANQFFGGGNDILSTNLSATLTRPANTTTYDAGDMIGAVTAKVKQVSTITLTGAGGLANVTGTAGLTKLVTFNTTLTQTATDFKNSHETAYDEADIPVTVTAVGETIVFTAKNYDETFIVPVIANVSDNLTGSITHSAANRAAVTQVETITLSGTAAAIQQETMAITATPHTKMKVTIPINGTLPVKQKEIITITGTSGTFTITGTGGFTNLVTWTTDEDGTATAFANVTNIAEYATAGVVLSANLHTIIFEAAVAGVPFTAPICTDGATDLHGTVDHNVANVVAGTANLTVVGLAPKLMTFNTNVATTISDFVTLWATSYYLGQEIVLTGSATAIILESTTLGLPFGIPDIVTLTGNLTHGTIVNDVVPVWTGNGTITGVGSPRVITYATSVDATAAAWVAANLTDYLAAGIDLTASTNNIVFTAHTIGVGFTSPVFVAGAEGDMAGGVTVNQVNVAQGTGTITGIGASKPITFNTTATQTATDFKNATNGGVTNLAFYAALGVTLSSSGADIIFTAVAAGTGFTSPIYTKTGGDLEGAIASTPTKYYANVTAVTQTETILVSGSSGQFTVILSPVANKVLSFTTNIQASLAAFVLANAAAYYAADIILTNSTTQLIFTAKTAGTGFTAPTLSGITDNLTGSVVSTPKVSYLPITIANTGISLGGRGKLNNVWCETDAVQFAQSTITCWMFNDVPTAIVADGAAFIDSINNAPLRTANAYFKIIFDALTVGSDRIFGRVAPAANYTCISTSKDLYMLVTTDEEVVTPKSAGIFQFYFDVTKAQ